MENEAKITVIIDSCNCESTLYDTLESSKDFDEIIIVNKNSQDEIVEIAKEYRAKIIYADKYEPYIALNQALDEAQGDWIFLLEDDEVVTENLYSEITNYILKPKKNKFALTVPQRLFYFDKEIKCARKKEILRFFKKGCCNFSDKYPFNPILKEGKIHKINKNFKSLKTCLYKFKKNSQEKTFEKIIEKNKFRLKENNKKSSVIIAPALVFIFWYIVKGAVFLGKCGFIYSKNKYFEEYLYQTMLYEKEKKSDI